MKWNKCETILKENKSCRYYHNPRQLYLNFFDNCRKFLLQNSRLCEEFVKRGVHQICINGTSQNWHN